MMRAPRSVFAKWVVSVAAMVLAPAAWAGGAWVPEVGQGDVELGASQKTAHTSWDSRGKSFVNKVGSTGQITYHDFRYAYLSGEVGLFKRLSTRFLMTYLDG